MKLFMLDMGSKIYGDCILAVEGNRKILIDGAHPGDWQSSAGTPSIPAQLGEILRTEPPFEIDLLVVTHCHSDHIGCLPKLVSDGTIECKWAFVADEKLGFPTDEQDAALDEEASKVVAAMREEPQPDLRGGALDEFLSDAVKLPENYRQMLATLKRNGTQLVRYTGPGRDVGRIEQEFSDFDLRVLGPTNAHLKICSEALARFKRQTRDAVSNLRAADASIDAAEIYLKLASRAVPADAAIPDDFRAYLDRVGPGAALNDQSIVLKLGSGPEASLLTGDMQLAEPEVSGLGNSMAQLLQDIANAGPYRFVKLPHHASYNGFDAQVLEAFKDTPAFGISTGRGDPNHPDSGVLDLLHSVEDQYAWARTDRNGVVSISFSRNKVKMDVSEGALNDASKNTRDVLPSEEHEGEGTEAQEPQITVVRSPRSGMQPPARAGTVSGSDRVEIFARVPHVATRITLTIDVDPGSAQAKSRPPDNKDKRKIIPVAASRSLAGGQRLPSLLFVTNRRRLADNIGKSESAEMFKVIESARHHLLDLDGVAERQEAIQRAASDNSGIKGVVILGGYDVLPAERYDTLPPSIRSELGASAENDPDDFIVWSDQIYGDIDGDQLADVPVSRIPDGRSSRLVQTALCGNTAGSTVQRFGLRNYERPFADGIYNASVAGAEPMLTSRQTRSQAVKPADVDAKHVYLMLHGSDSDGSRFWGETPGGMLEALAVGNVPETCGAIVFSGCCWGALTVRTKAMLYRDGDPIQCLTPEQSIALCFLEQGARAFIGCTGAHYSPVDGNLNYFGAPMHARFWSHVAAGERPAQALFSAKIDYIAGMPHGRTKVEELAIENKLLRQFTCLGLGW
jgi:beta-lactamase superfamily II metal-dependent hydrolase